MGQRPERIAIDIAGLGGRRDAKAFHIAPFAKAAVIVELVMQLNFRRGEPIQAGLKRRGVALDTTVGQVVVVDIAQFAGDVPFHQRRAVVRVVGAIEHAIQA
ncbi:hypothetical protein D3C71_1446970 [compost metagenome]